MDDQRTARGWITQSWLMRLADASLWTGFIATGKTMICWSVANA